MFIKYNYRFNPILSVDRDLIAYANHKGLIGTGICVAVSLLGFGHVFFGFALNKVEGSKNVGAFHERDKAVIKIDVDGNIVPLVADSEDDACIKTTDVLEGGAVGFGAGNVSVIVERYLRHSHGHLAIPAATE